MLAFLRTTSFRVLFKLKNNNHFLLSLVLLSTPGICLAQNPADVCASAVAIIPTLTCSSTAYTLPGTYAYEGLTSSCGSTQDDGWYTFTAQTSNYTFVLGGDFNHAVAVYSGTCGALTPIACANASSGTNATLLFTVTPNTTYFIQVQRNSGTTTSTMNGSFSFCYTSAPGGIKANIKAWYKADGNLVKSGSNVTQWNTEVGTVNFNSVFNTPTLNATSVNFNPSVVFPGDAYLNNSSVLGSDILAPSNNTVFLVTKVNSGGVLLKWDQDQSANRFDFETTPYPASTAFRFDHPGDVQSIATPATLNQWNIATAATSATSDNFIVNGLTGATSAGGTNNTSLSANLTMGGDSYSSFHSNSEITEAVFYGGTLSTTELRKVHSYLAVKYGITLGTNANALDYYSSNGTTIWQQTTTDQNDVAGLARDDASGLLQLKAKSSSTDDIITMALVDNGGTFAAPNTFDNDNEFMLWGNDNGGQPYTTLSGGLLESTTECPSAILRRLSRQWKIYETGTVGDVALTMDLSSIPISGTTFYDLRLLIDLDGDGDFTTGTVKRITPSAYVGGIVTFNNVDFNHGDIFTLATLVPSPGGVSSGLQIWLRASSLTSTQTNNAQLNSWYNAGSSNFDFSRIVGSNSGWPRFRTSSINFNHSIEFGSLGAMISQNSAVNMRPTTNSSTSMVVFKSAQTTSNTNFWSCPNFVTTEAYYTGRDYGFGLSNGKLGIKIKDGETWDANSVNSCNDNVPHLAMAMRVRNAPVTNTSSVTIQLDGKTEVSAAAVGDSYALDASDQTLPSYRGTGIGGSSVSGFDVYSSMQFTGQMSEVIVFNNNLSAANLNKVNTYLAIKYGLTLGNNSTPIAYTHSLGTTIWSASATYQNDIAAIGRDDRSELDQRRSVSIDTDNMTDIALIDNGGNQASPNAFDNDREFFIIGNNDGARSFSPVDVDGATILNRLGRVWKVQETGSVGNVMVAVNLSAVPTAITGSDLRLLIDRDNDGFADNDVTPQAADSYNAGTKTAYFTTDMLNGDLFTVGTATNALPVEFISIKANAETDRNKITWITATELNNSRFEVQRRIQGQKWDSIGSVAGANNSNSIHNYEFYDADVEHLTFVYYRVVQYDYDGKSDASKIVYVDRTALTNSSNLIKIGPNPSNGVIDISINPELFISNSYRVTVYSMLGIQVFDSELKDASSRIDLSYLPSENYIIELLNSTGTAPIYEKIIIRHQ